MSPVNALVHLSAGSHANRLQYVPLVRWHANKHEHVLLQAGDSIMVAHSDLTEAALGMSLGYFLTDIAVIMYHFPDMVRSPVLRWRLMSWAGYATHG